MNHTRLICYQLACATAKRVPALVGRWPRSEQYLADQLKRAMASVILNIAEGNGRRGTKERRYFFSVARASAAEVSAALDVAEAFGLIASDQSIEMHDNLLQIIKILYKLK
jgi:four helix bundle protein